MPAQQSGLLCQLGRGLTASGTLAVCSLWWMGLQDFTFPYLAGHLALYSIKDNTAALNVFICFVELITAPCVF